MIRLAILLAIVVSLTGCDGGYRKQQQMECQNASYGKTYAAFPDLPDHETSLRIYLFTWISEDSSTLRYIKCLEINN